MGFIVNPRAVTSHVHGHSLPTFLLISPGLQCQGRGHRTRGEAEAAGGQNSIFGEKSGEAGACPSQVWSCYSTQNWNTNDIIEFDSCNVNTVTGGDPALGLLPIAEAGTYRLTFMGMIAQCGGCDVEYAEVSIKLNNEVIATAGMSDIASDGSRGAKSSVSIDILCELQANDIISVELEAVNSGLFSDAKGFTQWTGQRLGEN